MTSRRQLYIIVAATNLSLFTLLIGVAWFASQSHPNHLQQQQVLDTFVMSSEDTFNTSIPINGEADFSNHSYQSIFGKEPPPGFHEWLQFAKKQQCTTVLSTYQQIYDDLAPFDRIYSKDFDLINRKGPARQQYITKGVFTKRRGFESKAMSPHLTLPLWNIFRSSTIKDFKYITSNMDEPISLPATDEYTGSYMNVNDTFTHNSCLRDRFDTKTGNETTPRMAHGYLLSPASFITQNINVPVLGMTKIPCFRDVMVPGSTSHVPITMNGRVEDEIPWKDKKNVLFWRGSTTGGQYGYGSNPPPWHGFHRIRLVEWAKRFGEKHPDRVLDVGKQEPISSDSSYQVDIGFSGVIQCNEKGVTGNECEKLRQTYPLKSKVGFKQTKQYKYLMVVDGNAWPNRLQTYLGRTALSCSTEYLSIGSFGS
ncbi:hypothetical protein BCR33DRAFT_337959 [Rhizoclosmatium globosum]|uniref:Glycosyl transferase CAP10 domain-containing protein n=1 Tax=Rhizoclosmatium globosum TaxID=329046 RepID=A0A1Y2C3S6_9FUNG|nr:hypothetical protein BCR33DRAFT_337959 [Rhizoclosmatium globosum]|eukprot:ORY41690.1 hypothetical protein BCR33DRAFT_337959 [Rhizoclosmatium globosum]